MRLKSILLSVIILVTSFVLSACSFQKMNEYWAIMDKSKISQDIKSIFNDKNADLKSITDAVIKYINDNKDGFQGSLLDFKNQLLAMVSKAISELNISESAKHYLIDQSTIISSQLFDEIIKSVKEGNTLEKVNSLLSENNVPVSLSEEDLKNLVINTTPDTAQMLNNVRVAGIDFKLDKNTEGVRRYKVKLKFNAEFGKTPVDLEANSSATFEKNENGRYELTEFKQDYINLAPPEEEKQPVQGN